MALVGAAMATIVMMGAEKLFKESHANYSGYCLNYDRYAAWEFQCA
jgi:hypothetical protein